MNDANITSVIKNKIEQSGKSPFLFIGSGISRRYAQSENWEDLLRYLCAQYSEDSLQYEKYRLDIKRESIFGEKPEIAGLIESDFAREVLDNFKLKDFKNNHIEDIKSGRSLVKIAIAEHLADLEVCSNQEEFLVFKSLENKISGIITTNYDTLLDTAFSKFTSYNGQDDLLFNQSFNMAEIYHIHGSIEDPDTLVLTSSDYENFTKKKDYLAAKLLTIFLEYPIIFMGYSIEDQNIVGILKSIANCLGVKKLAVLKDRLIFIDRGEDGISTYSKSFDNIGTVEMTKVTTDNFTLVYNAILDTNISFAPAILRELRKQIYQISEETDPTSKVTVTGFSGLEKIPDDQKVIIGLGRVNSKVPGSIVTADMVYRDVVLDDQYLTPQLMIDEHLEHLLGGNSGGLPIHKYISGYTGEINTPRLRKCINEHQNIESFRNNQLKKSSTSYRIKEGPLSVSSVINREGKSEAYKKLVLLNEDEIDLDELESYLVELVSSNREIIKGNSELKRLIKMYDLLKYKSKTPSTNH